MRMARIGLLASLVAGLVSTATWAQPAPRGAASVQSLAMAERALIDALMHRDRAAFQKLLTTETVFFFPKMSQGPEAIVASWLPFLIEGGPTMVITSDGVAVSGSNQGSSTAMFAIRGETEAGPRTIPAGTLAISWRRIGGAWKVSALDGAGAGGARLSVVGGVGGYRFGMSREEVSRVSDCKPYANVSSTAGLECPYYTFEGRSMNISFLFNAGGLYRIQLWFYEGESESAAREAVGRVIAYLVGTTGGVSIGGLPEVEVTPDVVLAMLRQPAPPGRVMQVEVSSRAGSGSEVWFARIARHQFGYHVLLFANRR